ncbi:hypothetical protein [uncultured Aquitalea sp.]|uniref:hypothetical protein n=1 Tax=uncultured Aquitalea sp. TaxID=540272 RepID=UPI0025E2A4E8|nr:hypothetical protein [uncultured Aquitalea sp.]
MEDIRVSQEVLEYLTRCMRHAVSNGQYLTPQLLEEAIEDFAAEHPQQNVAILH